MKGDVRRMEVAEQWQNVGVRRGVRGIEVEVGVEALRWVG